MPRSWKIAFTAALLLSLGAEFALPMEHHGVEYWWMSVPVFFAAFGLAGCLLIILVSKWLGGIWLQRTEDYYAQFRPGEDSGDSPSQGDAASGSETGGEVGGDAHGNRPGTGDTGEENHA